MSLLTKLANADQAVSETVAWGTTSNAYSSTDANASATNTPSAKNQSNTHSWAFPAFSTAEIPDGSTISSVVIRFSYKSSTTGSTGAVLGCQGDVAGATVGTETTYAMTTAFSQQTKDITASVTLADLRTANRIRARFRSSRAASNTGITWSLDYAQIEVTYSVGYLVTAGPGTAAITGSAVGLRATRTMVADAGSATVGGSDAILAAGRVVSAAAGSIALTGSAATLTYAPSSGAYTLVAAAGSVAATGQDVALRAARTMAASGGSAAVAGQSVTLRAGRVMPANSRTMAVTGAAATLGVGRRLVAGAAAHVVTGAAVTLRMSHRLVVTPIATSINGFDASLRYSGGGGEAPNCEPHASWWSCENRRRQMTARRRR